MREAPTLPVSYSRGPRRVDEQMALLRALSTNPAVTFAGREHHLECAGLNPLPCSGPSHCGSAARGDLQGVMGIGGLTESE